MQHHGSDLVHQPAGAQELLNAEEPVQNLGGKSSVIEAQRVARCDPALRPVAAGAECAADFLKHVVQPRTGPQAAKSTAYDASHLPRDRELVGDNPGSEPETSLVPRVYLGDIAWPIAIIARARTKLEAVRCPEMQSFEHRAQGERANLLPSGIGGAQEPLGQRCAFPGGRMRTG